MTTRMVSPKPLSVFVPDVTLIAFPIPAGLHPRGDRTFSSRESLFHSRQENGLDTTDVESKFRRKPEFALARYCPCGVLDVCSRTCNQAPYKNFAIH
jgi:hypothetical protein